MSRFGLHDGGTGILRNHLAPWNHRRWTDLHGDRRRLLRRPLEELGQDDRAVLRCDDPGHLEHDRDAQFPRCLLIAFLLVPQRFRACDLVAQLGPP